MVTAHMIKFQIFTQKSFKYLLVLALKCCIFVYALFWRIKSHNIIVHQHRITYIDYGVWVGLYTEDQFNRTLTLHFNGRKNDTTVTWMKDGVTLSSQSSDYTIQTEYSGNMNGVTSITFDVEFLSRSLNGLYTVEVVNSNTAVPEQDRRANYSFRINAIGELVNFQALISVLFYTSFLLKYALLRQCPNAFDTYVIVTNYSKAHHLRQWSLFKYVSQCLLVVYILYFIVCIIMYFFLVSIFSLKLKSLHTLYRLFQLLISA